MMWYIYCMYVHGQYHYAEFLTFFYFEKDLLSMLPQYYSMPSGFEGT